MPGLKNTYKIGDGPCVCVDGKSHNDKVHGKLHKYTKKKLRGHMMHPNPKKLTYEDAINFVAEAHAETFTNDEGSPQCNPDCMKAQMNSVFNKHKSGKKIEVRQKDGSTRKNFEKYRINKKGKGK